jgi:hypothetical protein
MHEKWLSAGKICLLWSRFAIRMIQTHFDYLLLFCGLLPCSQLANGIAVHVCEVRVCTGMREHAQAVTYTVFLPSTNIECKA